MPFVKKVLSAVAAAAVSASMAMTACAPAAPEPPETLKILCIGNSFSTDTAEYVAQIALDLGVQDVTVGNLYIGGCSIRKHYYNATTDAFAYEYYLNTGDGWTMTKNRRIRDVIKSDGWDYIAIQHGTSDGSRYAEEEYYEKLPALARWIRDLAPEKTKIAFNMTWVGERNSHEEMLAFGNQQERYYQAIADLTRDLIVPMENIDIVSPTGTAVQNARSAKCGVPLTRDNYHLSLEFGRYIAGLTFFKALTGCDISAIEWAPDGVNDTLRTIAVQSAENAVATPFEVTAYIKNDEE